MKAKNINCVGMKINNEKLVLDTIRDFGSISRRDVAKNTGLTPATVTNIVAMLSSREFVNETGTEKANGGRRAVLLSVNPTKYYFIGVEFKTKEIISLITDFEAKIVCERTLRVEANHAVDTIISLIVEEIEAIIAEANVDRDKIWGVGLCAPGPCDIENGLITNPPNLKGWSNVPIKSLIEERTGLKVYFEKSTSMAALAEYWFGDAKTSNCVFLCGMYEVGIGGSILIDGEVFSGFGGNSGEIGHTKVDINGPKCGCGGYGCLEAMADGRALLEYVKKELKTNHASCIKYNIEDVDSITLAQILERAEKKEALFYEAVKMCAKYIGIALNNVILTISPDTIIFTADLSDKSPILVDEIRHYLAKHCYPQNHDKIKMYRSKHAQRVGAMGGVAMMFRDIFR